MLALDMLVVLHVLNYFRRLRSRFLFCFFIRLFRLALDAADGVGRGGGRWVVCVVGWCPRRQWFDMFVTEEC